MNLDEFIEIPVPRLRTRVYKRKDHPYGGFLLATGNRTERRGREERYSSRVGMSPAKRGGLKTVGFEGGVERRRSLPRGATTQDLHRHDNAPRVNARGILMMRKTTAPLPPTKRDRIFGLRPHRSDNKIGCNRKTGSIREILERKTLLGTAN